ncbi:hypothetical protein LTR92_011218 [Exophiala xenobiotica]|nr:hypothetical protein LTR92_011218 [Exophiala xenobiotica]KAK5312029.1 hypothetical protein LTR93_011492 [Exophiala xenobiotica]
MVDAPTALHAPIERCNVYIRRRFHVLVILNREIPLLEPCSPSLDGKFSVFVADIDLVFSHIDALQAQVRSLRQQLDARTYPDALQTLSAPPSGNDLSSTPVNGPKVLQDHTENAHPNDLTHETCNAEANQSTTNNVTQREKSPSDSITTQLEDGLLSDGIICGAKVPSQVTVGSPAFSESSSLRFAWHLQTSIHALGLGGQEVVMTSPGNSDRVRPATMSRPEIFHRHLPQARGFADEKSIVAMYLTSNALNLLPQERVARYLFSRYLTHVHPIKPYLVEEKISRQFEETWTSDKPLGESWTAQLYMIFALACLFHDDDIDGESPVKDITATGEQFFYRAWGYIVTNAFSTCDISFLQLLLLAIQYQQGTNRGNQCWLTVGHASRIALSLGLHIPPSSSSQAGDIRRKQELHQLLWWGCYNLDRMISGRPTGILFPRQNSHVVDSLKVIDKLFVLSEPRGTGETPSIYAFFFCSVKLYVLMDKIFESLRTLQTTAGSGENPTTHRSLFIAILDLDADLLDWHSALPEWLKFSLDKAEQPPTEYPVWLRRQRCILALRFLGMRILLHRQSVLFLLRISAGQGQTYTFNCLCILIALLSLHRQGCRVEAQDHDRTQQCILAGFRLIRSMASKGGIATIRSEEFLRELQLSVLDVELQGLNGDPNLAGTRGNPINRDSNPGASGEPNSSQYVSPSTGHLRDERPGLYAGSMNQGDAAANNFGTIWDTFPMTEMDEFMQFDQEYFFDVPDSGFAL